MEGYEENGDMEAEKYAEGEEDEVDEVVRCGPNPKQPPLDPQRSKWNNKNKLFFMHSACRDPQTDTPSESQPTSNAP